MEKRDGAIIDLDGVGKGLDRPPGLFADAVEQARRDLGLPGTAQTGIGS